MSEKTIAAIGRIEADTKNLNLAKTCQHVRVSVYSIFITG